MDCHQVGKNGRLIIEFLMEIDIAIYMYIIYIYNVLR